MLVPILNSRNAEDSDYAPGFNIRVEDDGCLWQRYPILSTDGTCVGIGEYNIDHYRESAYALFDFAQYEYEVPALVSGLTNVQTVIHVVSR